MQAIYPIVYQFHNISCLSNACALYAIIIFKYEALISYVYLLTFMRSESQCFNKFLIFIDSSARYNERGRVSEKRTKIYTEYEFFFNFLLTCDELCVVTYVAVG